MLDKGQQEGQRTTKVSKANLSLRRIVVALDASSSSRAALATALQLAEMLHAELIGLFVEDINLLRLCQLPFAREVTFTVATSRELDHEQIERLLRVRAAEIRHEVEEETRKRRIHSDFRVVRGAIDAEILSAALEADLLALGQTGFSIARRRRLGSTARMAIARVTVPVLLAHPGGDLGRPVAVVVDGSAAAGRALDFALGLAQQKGRLSVYLWAERDEQEESLRQTIGEQGQELGISVNFERLRATDVQQFLLALRKQLPGLLVLGIAGSQLPPDLLEALLEDGSQQILAVR